MLIAPVVIEVPAIASRLAPESVPVVIELLDAMPIDWAPLRLPATTGPPLATSPIENGIGSLVPALAPALTSPTLIPPSELMLVSLPL